MKIKKSSLALTVFALVVVGLLSLAAFVYKDANTVWDKESSWETSPKFTFPKQSPDVNYTIKVDESTNTTTFDVQSCTLYKSEVQGKSIEYSCTLTAPQILELNKNTNSLTPTQDIVFTFEYGKDPMPKNFFSVSPLDELTFQIAGKNPIEAAMTLELKKEMPNKTPLRMISHYLKVKSGAKDSYPVKLLSWEVEDAVKAGLKKAGGKEKYLELWRANTLAEVNKELLAKKVDVLEGQDLLNAVRDVFQYQNSKCSKVNGQTSCVYSYPQNAADALVYYLYIQSVANPNDKLYKRIKNAVEMYTVPFIDKYNKSYKVPESPDCDPNLDSCTVFYQIVNAYQYSICPIQDVMSGNKNSTAVKLFTEYIELSGIAQDPTNMAGVSAYIKSIPEPVPSNSSGFPDFDSSVNINAGCYLAIKYGVTDKSLLGQLEKRYFESVALKLSPNSKVPLKNINDVKDFIIAQQVSNKYTRFPYIGDSSIVSSRNETELESLSEQIENKVSWGNFPLSLALFYLSLNTTK